MDCVLRKLVIGVGIVVVLFLVAFIGLYAGQRSLMYFPDTSSPAAPKPDTGLREVSFRTADGLTLRTWRADPVAQPPGAPPKAKAVLYAPGNGGNRLGRAGIAMALAQRGYTVLLLEYRGYGGNPGEPTEDGLAQDAEAALNYLREQGFDADHTVYVGESLGTGVVTRLATTHEPAALVLRSPYTNMVDIASAHLFGLPAELVKDRYDALARIPQVTAPVTVLIGSADDVVPPQQSVQIANAAPNLRDNVVLPGVGHNDEVWFGADMARFIDKAAQ
ncbi:MAG: alpha/beta hydrolase [Micrococcales bacterium]|nr:MAG: alpha/beta hydrolase [Micrococcales bacterium]PIE26509.1 MAG: alpha/beta hydrolase [Micrococcales bacterium]